MAQSFRGYSVLKGITSTNSKQKYDRIVDITNDTSIIPISEKAQVELGNLMDYCSELDCRVLFVRFPHRITGELGVTGLRQSNEVGRIVKSNGFDFINLEYNFSEIGLDADNDFYSDSHLNADGQVKLTRYFSSLLIKKYGLQESELDLDSINRWNNSYESIKLFYKYYNLHKNDDQELWWKEDTQLLSELDRLR